MLRNPTPGKILLTKTSDFLESTFLYDMYSLAVPSYVAK